MTDQSEEIILPVIEDPEEWAKLQAENEMPEEEREAATAEVVEVENTEAREVNLEVSGPDTTTEEA